ncbi:hypothetical protein O181_058971 [Austropuccinia psidii MF-1]|uniref:Thioredoxin domain-containing protein n=1 Tax=Austropuccinia psidii MF-1 TaxID=1389203 RepID=A0A9Q3EBC3_9BASI|nr:hypothetical protein [Austropuccinia psidii MF-1]
MITEIKSLDQLNKIISSNKNSITIIDFHAQWCGPCHAIAGLYQSLSNSNPNLTFLKCDVDHASEVSRHFQITAMPTFMFLRSGVKIDQIKGADKSKLEQLVKKYSSISQSADGQSYNWKGEGHKLGTSTSTSSSTPTNSQPARSIDLTFPKLIESWNQLSGQHQLGICLILGYLLLIYLS